MLADLTKKIFFIGIGGAGMSSLARFFISKKTKVFGYDSNRSNICDELEHLGAKISYVQSLDFLLDNKLYVNDILVVYTPAIKSNNKFLKFFKENDFNVLKRSELLSEITKDKFLIAVAGSHGKTTTTALISHILLNSDFPVTCFIGGICQNGNSNFLSNNKKGRNILVEADEFDRSFLKLNPNIAIITSIDMDHSDCYSNFSNLKKSFHKFISNICDDGILIIENEAYTKLGRIDFKNVVTYSVKEKTNFNVTEYKIVDNFYKFKVSQLEKGIQDESDFFVSIPGKHNLLNTLSSIIVSLKLGISQKKISESLKSFLGVKRRFEIHFESSQKVYVDDYAHHPQEIKKTLETLRELYPRRKITVVFQPHLYSRTKDFMQEFADVLSSVNHLILLEIFAARENPINGINSIVLLEKCSNKKKDFIEEKNLVKLLNSSGFDVLVTMGAGNISNMVEQIKKNCFVN